MINQIRPSPLGKKYPKSSKTALIATSSYSTSSVPNPKKIQLMGIDLTRLKKKKRRFSLTSAR